MVTLLCVLLSYLVTGGVICIGCRLSCGPTPMWCMYIAVVFMWPVIDWDGT